MEINESQFLSQLGKNINKIRINSDFSLEEMSKLSGIEVDMLKSIEAGRISVHLMDFVIIAKSLKVEPSSLVDFTK